MRAVAYTRPCPIEDDDSLIDIELAEPVPLGRDLLVRVEAVSVNPIDAKVRSGRDPGGEPRVLGFDAAGTVVAVGPQAELFRPGDPVFYAGQIDRHGSNSELQLADERIVGRRPASLSPIEAAALPLTSVTAWELLFDRLAIPGADCAYQDSLLVVGGAGGVGSALIQLARARTGLRIIATASRPETAAWARAMGAHEIVDHTKPLAKQVLDIEPSGIRYIASLTQTSRNFDQLAEIVCPEGRIGLIDDLVTPPDLMKLKAKSVSLHWESMFTRSLFRRQTVVRQHEILEAITALVEAKLMRTTLNRGMGEMSAASLREAHAAIETSSTIGKIGLLGYDSAGN